MVVWLVGIFGMEEEVGYDFFLFEFEDEEEEE